MAEIRSPQAASESGIYVYDIETYPNCFLAIFKEVRDARDGEFRTFDGETLDALKQFLNANDLALIGYNNFAFDDVILKVILAGRVATPSEIHQFAERILKAASKDCN
jgi:hypothetical protein